MLPPTHGVVLDTKPHVSSACLTTAVATHPQGCRESRGGGMRRRPVYRGPGTPRGVGGVWRLAEQCEVCEGSATRCRPIKSSVETVLFRN